MVRVTNSIGAVTSTVATVTVTPMPPRFTIEPESATVFVGSRVSLSGYAAGTEPITYQWQFNRADIEGQTNASLIWPFVRSYQAGKYRLVAGNSAGTGATREVELEIRTVLAWGWNMSGQTNVPANLQNVVQIAAGAQHSLALLRNGKVMAWGDWRLTNVPPNLTDVMAVAAGGSQSLALKRDGTVAAWPNNAKGDSGIPPGLSGVVAISAGTYHYVALKEDGTVVAWGLNTDGQCNVPLDLTNAIAVAVCGHHSLALRSDGTVLGWGNNQYGQSKVPNTLTGVVAVAAGAWHSMALRADGTVAIWGSSSVPACIRRPQASTKSWPLRLEIIITSR